MSHDADDLVLSRIDRVFADLVHPARVAERVALSATAWEVKGEPVSFDEAVAGDFVPLARWSRWGAPWSTLWIRVSGQVPPGWQGDLDVVVDLGFSPAWPGFQAEGQFWSPSRRPLAGLEPRNDALRLRRLSSGEAIEVLVEAAANPDLVDGWSFRSTPLGDPATAGDEPLYVFGGADLVRPNRAGVDLDRDWALLRQMVEVLPKSAGRRARVVTALHAAADFVVSGGDAMVVREALASALVSRGIWLRNSKFSRISWTLGENPSR